MSLIAHIETNHGTMEVKLFKEKVPNTVKNFVHLASKGYYNNLVFHRIIKDFMVQGGCPDGLGTGGPGYRFADEFDQDLRHDSKGILSMANSGPNSNGSQFFITLVPTPWLDDKHSVFGELVKGESVLDKLGAIKTGAGDRPLDDCKIISIKIYQDKNLLEGEQEKPEII